jgi:hypothetical protein
VVVISTAGSAEERRGGILGQLLDANEEAGELEQRPGLTISPNEGARVIVFNYSAPTNDSTDIDALLLANSGLLGRRGIPTGAGREPRTDRRRALAAARQCLGGVREGMAAGGRLGRARGPLAWSP